MGQSLQKAAAAAYIQLLALGSYESRHTEAGQTVLCWLREALADASGVSSQDIQTTAELIGGRIRRGDDNLEDYL